MVLSVQVLTPERVVCSTKAKEVILPGLTGQIGVLDGHVSLMTMLDTGVLKIKIEEKWIPILLFGGVAEVYRDRVTVLGYDIQDDITGDINEVSKELEKAISVFEKADTRKDVADAALWIKRATSRLEALNLLA